MSNALLAYIIGRDFGQMLQTPEGRKRVLIILVVLILLVVLCVLGGVIAMGLDSLREKQLSLLVDTAPDEMWVSKTKNEDNRYILFADGDGYRLLKNNKGNIERLRVQWTYRGSSPMSSGGGELYVIEGDYEIRGSWHFGINKNELWIGKGADRETFVKQAGQKWPEAREKLGVLGTAIDLNPLQAKEISSFIATAPGEMWVSKTKNGDNRYILFADGEGYRLIKNNSGNIERFRVQWYYSRRGGRFMVIEGSSEIRGAWDFSVNKYELYIEGSHRETFVKQTGQKWPELPGK